MYEVTKCAPQEALRNLEQAFKNFFRRVKNGEKPGFPKFKSKHKDKDSYKISTGSVYITNITVKIPNIGIIKLKEHNYIPLKNVKYNSYTISKKAGHWFISVQCEEEISDNSNLSNNVLGIDIGIKNLVTDSNGSFYDNVDYKKLDNKINKLQKERSRRKLGSKNRHKTVKKIQNVYYKKSNILKDNIHKITKSLVKTKPKAIVIEDLSTKNMLQNHKLSKSISDSMFGEIKRQILYKSKWLGIEVVLVDRFYPSSKLCSCCGHKKDDLKLSDRIYKCDNCSLIIDRDLNAAINIKNYYSTASSVGTSAKSCKRMMEKAVVNSFVEA
jgi:putative transposase